MDKVIAVVWIVATSIQIPWPGPAMENTWGLVLEYFDDAGCPPSFITLMSNTTTGESKAYICGIYGIPSNIVWKMLVRPKHELTTGSLHSFLEHEDLSEYVLSDTLCGWRFWMSVNMIS